jgi:long-chain acyl-CoA synthetase
VLRTEYVTAVPATLARQARERPERIAFVDDVRALTYGELAATTARLAGHLQERGVRPGERVLLLLDNRVEVAEACLAGPRAGAVTVCANPAAAPAEVAHILADSGACVVVTDAAHLATVRELADARTVRAVVVVGEPAGAAGAVPEVRYADLLATPAPPPRDGLALDDTAWMLYTSGTTGRPKGVMYHHRGAYLQALAMVGHTGLSPSTVHLWTLPMFHSTAGASRGL